MLFRRFEISQSIVYRHFYEQYEIVKNKSAKKKGKWFMMKKVEKIQDYSVTKKYEY